MNSRPRKVGLTTVFASLAFVIGRPAAGQTETGCTPTPPALKQHVLQLRAANSDNVKFFNAISEAVGFEKVHMTDRLFVDVGIIVDSVKEIAIMVAPPFWRYSSELREAIRKREPIEAIDPPDGVHVLISPSRIDAPDIEKVILERDGHPVPPIASSLKPTPLETPLGARKILHQGTVVFPCSAFAQGGRTVLTLIPRVGDNIVKTFDEFETWLLGPHQLVIPVQKKPPAAPISTLVGLTGDALRQRLGNPTSIDGSVWYFETRDHGTLQILFRRDGTVSSALPNDFDLAWIQRN